MTALARLTAALAAPLRAIAAAADRTICRWAGDTHMPLDEGDE